MSEHPIRYILEFCRLVRSPDACPKKSRMLFRAAMSLLEGLMKVATSSAYKDKLIPLSQAEMECRTPLSVAMWRIRWRGSMVRMKSMGKMGSPCQRSLSCLMGFLGIPLRRILDEVVDRANLIYSLHLILKPIFSRISRRYARETESKALAMPNLTKSAIVFFLWNSFTRL
jgi:hypothetical protein